MFYGQLKDLSDLNIVALQKRRLTRLQTFFGWNIHYVDSTKFISCKPFQVLVVSSLLLAWCLARYSAKSLGYSHVSGRSDELWAGQVVGTAVNVIRAFLTEKRSAVPDLGTHAGSGMKGLQKLLTFLYYVSLFSFNKEKHFCCIKNIK